MEYGMSDRLGPMRYGQAGGEVFLGRDYNRQADYSDEVAAFIDEEVRALIAAAHEEARAIIETHIDALHRIVELLKEEETIDQDQIEAIFFDVPKWEHVETGSLRIRLPEGFQPPPAPTANAAAISIDS